MDRLNQVVIQWDEETLVTITVTARRFGHIPSGHEQRLAELIAATLWSEWQLSELAALPEE